METPFPAYRNHAADRLALALLSIVECPHDPRTLETWGRASGASAGTLRTWCQAARVRPKSALDFGRLLRAIVRGADAATWDLNNLLDVVDSRTLAGLLARGGLPSSVAEGPPPSVDAFLRRQTLVNGDANLAAIRRVVTEEFYRKNYSDF